jgi:hypothetical protein
MSSSIIRPAPKAQMGHPDPNHPTNRFKGDDAGLVDYHGNPVVDKAAWSTVPTNLWLFITVCAGTGTPLPMASEGGLAPRQATWSVGGITLAVGCTEGRPRWDEEVFGNAIELPSDLGRDPTKQTLIMDWLRDMGVECLMEAKASMGFSGFPGSPMAAVNGMGRFLQGGAERSIKGMGL